MCSSVSCANRLVIFLSDLNDDNTIPCNKVSLVIPGISSPIISMPLLILGGISLIHGSNISVLLIIPNVDTFYYM